MDLENRDHGRSQVLIEDPRQVDARPFADVSLDFVTRDDGMSESRLEASQNVPPNGVIVHDLAKHVQEVGAFVVDVTRPVAP